jgi:hypothetical protein
VNVVLACFSNVLLSSVKIFPPLPSSLDSLLSLSFQSASCNKHNIRVTIEATTSLNMAPRHAGETTTTAPRPSRELKGEGSF